MKFSFLLWSKAAKMTRILCVAEKNDAAKNIAYLLSRGQTQRTEGRSVYNKIYRFEGQFQNQHAEFYFTSVSGHLLNLEFPKQYSNWRDIPIANLFEAPVERNVAPNMENIARTLREQAILAQGLIIWTDCDREGEHIGAEIVQVCKNANINIEIYRARFSEITGPAVQRALQNVVPLNLNIVAAVDCRTELDLRIGAAFTRLQTIHLQNSLPAVIDKGVISYGSCQFPTLGFVVERFKAIKEFIAEPFWRLIGKHSRGGMRVEFVWDRNRLFDKEVVSMLLIECNAAKGTAKIISIKQKPKTRWRPVALDTVEFEKLAVRKLHISAKEAMAAAERLYSKGYISYPRTETNIYPKELQLAPLVQAQTTDDNWGAFSQDIINRGGPNPRNGRKTDEAHPPIHPLKAATRADLNRDWFVYEMIVRHFLACVSRDATGQETVVEVSIADEIFKATGLQIDDLGYLEVWKYDKWSDKTLPTYRTNEVLKDFVVEMNESRTTAPQLLNEADLIALMEKHGIGTDATHAEHIEKIQTRNYVTLNREKRFIPGYLGLALVDAYNEMGFEMSKPNLRANLESQLVEICNGTKGKAEVLQEQIRNYKNIFVVAENRIQVLSVIFNRYLNSQRQAPSTR